MKKSRIIALLTAAVMIMGVIPAYADVRASVGGYFVDSEGAVYEKSGENMIENPGFENGLTGLTENEEYYEVSSEVVHSGAQSLKAIKSTKGDGAITVYYPVDDANDSYYLSFWYQNTDEVARRPRVTFAFTDSSKVIPTVEDDFTDATNAWIQAGTASNDQDMAYSKGDWVQYSTVLKGNGNADACAYVVLNIYGLTKNVAYVDDFELYTLSPADEFGDKFADAIAEWETKSMPHGSLEGFGTIELPREVNVDGIGVEWTSSSVAINVETGEYSSQAEEELVILTAKLYVEGREDVFYTYEYPLIVKSMFVPYVEWMNTEVLSALGSSVAGDLTLPKTHEIAGYYPATITWSCSDETVIDADGKFTAPETTKYVDLIATIECNGETTVVTKRMKAIGGNIVGDGLVMYYDFEKPLGGKGTLYDNSQNENVYDAKVENVNIVNGYGQFNSGTIILPTNYGTALTGSYSVSMWANLDKSIAASGAMFRFFDFGGGTYTSQFLRYIPATGQLTFMDRGTAGNGSTWAIDTTVTDMAQTWRLVTFTYDYSSTSSVAKVYIDGNEIASSGANTTLTNTISAIATQSSTTGFIGRTQWANGDNPDFVGLMDDVRIYNRAITADEVATLYNETRPTITAPVTIKFQDLEGNTLKDDVIVSADVDTDYDVPASYKNLPASSEGNDRFVYKYVATQSIDSVSVSANGENVCILKFQKEKQAAGANLISNPSFEDGIDGWTTTNYSEAMKEGSSFKLVNDATHGTKALQLLSAQGSASTGAMSTRWNVDPNTEYEFSFDIKHPGRTQVTTGFLELMDSNGSNLGHIAGENPGQVWSGSGEYLPTSSDGSWVTVKYVFTTTATTSMVGLKIAWFGGSSPVTVDNFKLKVAGFEDPEEGGEDDSDKIAITIKYVDQEGNTIKDDEVVKVPAGTNEYTVPASYKAIEDKYESSLVYKYTYNEKATGGRDVVSVSILRDNVATLVFEVLKADKNANLMVDGDFMGEDGKFSWGTWQSPETSNYFSATCQDWFYQVDRDTNASQLYLTGLTADDYAVGTRWNDGTNGLCSMANFIPVQKGKTYIVSYDYKHQTAGTDASYISTSFVTAKNMGAGQASGANIPKNVSTNWQTNTFTITAPQDGYIYFHFSWLGSGGPSASTNNGSGPYWYFDNFEVLEAITFENEITYNNGYAEILAEDGTEGYLVQAMYDAEGALTSVVISEKLTLNQEVAARVEVQAGAKLMLVKDLTSLEPLAPAIIAE